ncbi:MAG: signal recognition particle-docking protein FtsY [Nitrososphaeraceae archaeon]|nr:signal recognition particle-docking protein FtsY [Nitrososphaeraceae archaeon]MBV9667833.1 signal recognition particle-docking protein FtsY [Nitrososphaeraceae archaeon]
MFDKLKKALSSVGIKNIGQKEISEKDVNDNLFDLQLALLESDVAQEVVDSLSARLKDELVGLKLDRGQQDIENIVRTKIQDAIAEMFAKAEKIDLMHKIKMKREARGGPFVIVFLGINGTGKTTTVAKMAHLLHKNGISVVLAAGDTHRAGAIEQLTQHAEKLSLKVISQRYGADPSAVARDAVDYGRKHHIDAVLIDTAGRMQTAKNLMDEISKIVRVVKPDMKLFIGDSLAGNDTINQAREFFQYTNFDGAVLTKTDADAKGGAAISIVHITSKPIVYLGVGQGYDNIVPFDSDKFLESIFSDVSLIDITSTIPKIRETEIEKPNTASAVGTLGAYTTITKEELKSTTPISPLSTISKGSNNQDSSTSIIAPKVEKEEKEEESLGKKPSEKKSTESTLTEDRHTRIENQQTVIEKGEQKEGKKSRFMGLFSRKDKDKKGRKWENGRKGPEVQTSAKVENQADSKDLDKQKEGSEEAQIQEKDNQVYLSDEDIEDLLK